MTVSKEFKDYILKLDQIDAEKFARAEEVSETIRKNNLVVGLDIDGETLIFKVKGED